MFRSIAFTVFALPCFSCATAADGDLDTSFGMNGIALSGSHNPFYAQPSKPARQTDGKIIVCEVAYDGLHEDFLVTRFAADGSFDDTFGTHGAVIVDFDGGNDECSDVGIESDGRIVLAGNSTPDPASNRIHFALARLNSDGSLDTSFGAGTGKFVFSFAQDGNEFATALAVHPYADGRIVVAGVLKLPSSNYDFAVARLAADGTFDSTFGNGGKVTVAFDLPQSASKNDHLSALAVDSSDRLLLAGDVSATADNADDFGVARLLPDGQLDGTFGMAGRAVIAFDTGFSKEDRLRAIRLQGDGRIVLGGSADTSPTPTRNVDFAVARLLPNGMADPDFGVGGMRTIAIDRVSNGSDTVEDILPQSDGKLLLAGTFVSQSGNRTATVRLNSDGSTDDSFGTQGKHEYELPGIDFSMPAGISFSQGSTIVSGVGGFPGVQVYDAFLVRLESELIFASDFD